MCVSLCAPLPLGPVVRVSVKWSYVLRASCLPFTHTHTCTQASCLHPGHRTQASLGEATCVIYFHSHSLRLLCHQQSRCPPSPLSPALACVRRALLLLLLLLLLHSPGCTVMSKSLFFTSSLVACFIATMAQEVCV